MAPKKGQTYIPIPIPYHGTIVYLPTNSSQKSSKNHVSNEKNPGWLDYIGDYTTQLYRDYNKPL